MQKTVQDWQVCFPAWRLTLKLAVARISVLLLHVAAIQYTVCQTACIFAASLNQGKDRKLMV